MEIVRNVFGYPESPGFADCLPEVNPTDRIAAASNPDRTDGRGDA